MGKKLKNTKQGLNSSLNLKQGKSKNMKKEKSKLLEVKSTLKDILYNQKEDKKDTISKENYNNNNEGIKYSNKDYITETFNSRIIHMLIIYINKNKEKLKLYKYDTEPNFINKFINLIKELCLNEIEVAYLTLLLDKFDWKFDGINNHWIYFYILGIYTKEKVTSEDVSVNLLESKEEVNKKYLAFVNDPKFEDYIKEGIKTQEINQRFKELTKPINTYCRKNFVNYNSIADKIIKMSQPYGEESNANQLIKEKIMEENEKYINKNNEEDIFEKVISQDGQNKISTFSMNKKNNDFENKRFGSILADKNTFNNNNMFFNNLNLKREGSDLSLIKPSSHNSLNFAFHSDNNF